MTDGNRSFLVAPIVGALMLIPLIGFSVSPLQAAEPAVTIPPRSG